MPGNATPHGDVVVTVTPLDHPRPLSDLDAALELGVELADQGHRGLVVVLVGGDQWPVGLVSTDFDCLESAVWQVVPAAQRLRATSLVAYAILDVDVALEPSEIDTDCLSRSMLVGRLAGIEVRDWIGVGEHFVTSLAEAGGLSSWDSTFAEDDLWDGRLDAEPWF